MNISNMDNHTIEDVMVFKTTILTGNDVEKVSPVLNADKRIRKWNVDLHDIDRVLRIESDVQEPAYIINIIEVAGFSCEELTY